MSPGLASHPPSAARPCPHLQARRVRQLQQQRRDLRLGHIAVLERLRDDAEAGHLGPGIHPKAVDMRKVMTEIALVTHLPGASVVARQQGEVANAQSLLVAFDAPA
jgi:hypothetical protein